MTDRQLTKIFKASYDRVLYKMAQKYQSIYEYFYFKKLRKRLLNKNFSLFSPNCYAGIIYHRLGLEFLSPTINLLFPSKKEYLRFVSNIEYYLSRELVFVNDSNYNCPVALLEDVKIVFNHDSSAEKAKADWERRKKRVNYKNIYILFDDIADAEYMDLLTFSKIDCKGKRIITAKDYPELDCCIQIKEYAKDGDMKAYLLDKSIWTGKSIVDKYFDVVDWLNN